MEWSDRIGRRIKLRDLHILLAVAECGKHGEGSRASRHFSAIVSKVIADLDTCSACVC